MLTPAPSGGGEGWIPFGAMLKKNKELNVFHHVWSHLTTSPNACLSSPSDPRCVQPCYKSRGKRKKRKQARAIDAPCPRHERTTAVLCHMGALIHHQNRAAWESFSPQAPTDDRCLSPPAAQMARRNRTPESL